MSADPTTLTIVVHLPISITTLARVLSGFTEIWPDAAIDTTHPDGWRLEVGPGE